MTDIKYRIGGWGDGSEEEIEVASDNLRGVMTFKLGEDGPYHQFEYQIEPPGLNEEAIISFFCKHNPRRNDANRVKLFYIVGTSNSSNQVIFDIKDSELKDKNVNDSLPDGGISFYSLIEEGKEIDEFVLNVEMSIDDRIAGGRRKKKSRKKKSHKKKRGGRKKYKSRRKRNRKKRTKRHKSSRKKRKSKKK
jgi:hypothetical protein